jgi:drug/metabolite transporter (DMT)-like permease
VRASHPVLGNNSRASLYALGACTLYACVSPFTVLALRQGVALEPLIAGRYIVAAVLFGALALAGPRIPLRPAERLELLLVGAVLQGGVVWLGLRALVDLPVATVTLLFYSYPLWVVLLTWVRDGERPDGRALAALGITAAGVAVLSGWHGQGWRVVSAAWVLLAAFLYAVQLRISRRIAAAANTSAGSFWLFTGTAISLGLGAAQQQSDALGRLDAGWWRYALGLGLACTFVPWCLVLRALRRGGPVQLALISTVEPVLAALLGLMLLHQAVTGAQLVGGAIVCGGVVLVSTRRASDRAASRTREAAR